MLSLFRRILNSRLGALVALIAIGVIGLLFALGDITGLRGGGGGAFRTGGPDAAPFATVGGAELTAAELKRRVQLDVDQFRAQQPGLTVQQYIDGGGFDSSINRLIDGLVVEQFAARHGLVVSKQTVDNQLAAIPALQGLNGKFDQKVYEQLLAQRRLTDAEVRRDIARSTLLQQLTLPSSGANQVSERVADPYAALLLERRSGQIAAIPTQAMGEGKPPSDDELKRFYARNRSRYQIAERRVMRYAIVDASSVQAAAAATDAEIAAAYRQQAARFAASEKRDITQVVIADKGAADALAAKVKGGTSIEAAAKAVGLGAAKLPGLTRDAYAQQAGGELAGLAFGAGRGGVIGPVKAPLGWTVAHVDAVTAIAARSLDQARDELAKQITADKTARALADLNAKLDDAINTHATFAELVADHKLTAQATPPLFADGRDPAAPAAAAPDLTLAAIAKAGFAAEQGDAPQIVATVPGGAFAVVALDKVVPAAAPPIETLKPALTRDFVIDRARAAARVVAAGVLAKVNGGTPLAEALAATGLRLPPAEPIKASRAQIQAAQGRVPPPLALLFSMGAKSARLLEAPGNGGWLIVYLNTIERSDARAQPAVVAAQRADLGRVIGGEYVQQLVQAMRREVGVAKHADVIAQVRKDLLGAGATP